MTPNPPLRRRALAVALRGGSVLRGGAGGAEPLLRLRRLPRARGLDDALAPQRREQSLRGRGFRAGAVALRPRPPPPRRRSAASAASAARRRPSQHRRSGRGRRRRGGVPPSPSVAERERGEDDKEDALKAPCKFFTKNGESWGDHGKNALEFLKEKEATNGVRKAYASYPQ